MRFPALILALPAAFAPWLLRAQDQAAEPPAPARPLLENHGSPMRVPFRCTNDDIRSAGLSCSEEEPCPVYLELSAAAHWGERTLVSGNIHGESVTLYSLLLETGDAGRTWEEAYPRIRGAIIDRIEFLDSGFGWVSGEELSPLPRNPFLLATQDGGKTWTEHAVLRESAENLFGSILQFVFTSNTAGSLILDRGQGNGEDRYALFQSETGGQSWSVRQESAKPLRLQQTLPPSSWRLRVDPASRSYRVEHLEGQRWNSIAAFAVNLDPCRPPPSDPVPDKQ